MAANRFISGNILHRFLVPVIAGVIFALFRVSGPAPALSGQTLDFLFMLRGPAVPSQEIIIVAIDEDSLNEIGAWPFQRKIHADLLARLSQARVIGFDILFSEPTDQDALLSRAFAESPPIILGAGHDFNHRLILPAPSLRQYSGLGLIETVLGSQGVVRRIDPAYLGKDAGLELLGQALADFADTPPTRKFSENRQLINFYGPEGTFLYLSYSDVLAGKYAGSFFHNRYVLVGAAARGLGDSHVTPYSRAYPMPGVEIQATILNNILDGTLLTEYPLFPWFGIAGLVLLNFFVWPRYNVQRNICINFVVGILFIGCALLFFRHGLLLDPSGPLVFMSLLFLVYLVSERIRTANMILAEMSALDHRLEQHLQTLYANIPEQFAQQPPRSGTGNRLDLIHLHAGIKTLSLQHHFIEKLLQKNLPPLILWDADSSLVILANTMFKDLWQGIVRDGEGLPSLADFRTLLRENQLPGSGPVMGNEKEPEGAVQEETGDICLEVSGRRKYFSFALHRVDAEDAGFEGILAILYDITESKEVELLKDEILSVVSHELKLPLTVMLGYGEMLSAKLTGRDKTQIDNILAQTVRMKKLIEHFLDIARLEHGRQNIHRLPFDPLKLVQQAQQAISSVAEKKSIALVTRVPHKATVLVGDFSLLSQALINLLDNAVKFSPGDTEIVLQLTEEQQELVFCVHDQGPGIPPEQQNEIFKKFNRGNIGGQKEGFGLGLSFVREVINRHDGELYIDPDKAEGASFCFTLPKHDDNML